MALIDVPRLMTMDGNHRPTAMISAAVACLVAGCTTQPSRIVAERFAADAAGQAMKLYDVDKDGSLDTSELLKAPGLRAGIIRIKNIDVLNHSPQEIEKTIANARLTQADIQTRLDMWRESKVGRLSIPCVVRRNGKPLAGAMVTAEPEAFLGGNLTAAAGSTNESGSVILSQTSDGAAGQPGLSPGYYRIRISLPGEPVPGVYDAETTLGMEVAADSPFVFSGRGLEFDLRF
jgi:hypothetical protein